jgi:hypothetical protein
MSTWPDEPPPLPSDETQKTYVRERFTIYLDPALARAFRIYSAERRKSLSDVVAEALSRLLGLLGEADPRASFKSPLSAREEPATG